MNSRKLIALTFDDGPNTTTTMQVLDLIEQYGITASFYVVGNNINDDSKAVMIRAVSLGCEIENHSQTHSAMTEMTAEEIAAEIKFTSDKIEAVTGRKPKFFRPPYIAFNQLMYDTIDLTFICGNGAEDYLDEVTPDMRRHAKTANFGILYGISAFGLAERLGISRGDANVLLDGYRKTYPRITEYMQEVVADAKEKGAISTMFGRIRPIPELSSSNFMQKQFGERIAMNSPIQGTAADIIKIAMIRVHDRLIREGFASRLILQVHDELLIETVESEKDAVVALLEEEMAGAVSLSVEMEVGTECGYNWYEAH